jgi:hypothetical protein
MSDDTPSEATAPAQPRRLAHWLARAVAAVAWALVVMAAAALAFAWLLPQDLRDRDQLHLAMATAAFVVDTFRFHLLLACALPVVVALLARR